MRSRLFARRAAAAVAVLSLAGCPAYTRLATYKHQGPVWVAVLPVADLTPQTVQAGTRLYRRPSNIDGPQLIYRMIVRDLASKQYKVLPAADLMERLRAHKVFDPVKAHTLEPFDLARWLDVDVVIMVTLVRFDEMRSPQGDLTLWITYDIQAYDTFVGRVILQKRFDERVGREAERWMRIEGGEGINAAAMDPYEVRVFRALAPTMIHFP